MPAIIDGSWESPRAGAGVTPGFSDAVTFAFGDPVANVFGLARAGLSTGADGTVTASGLVLVFVDGEPVAVRADGAVAIDVPRWETIDAAGLRTTIQEPLRAWTVSFAGDQGEGAFELQFAATALPAVLEDGQPAARVGGMAGYEVLCRVTGTVATGGATRTIDGLGQRGHSWGAPDWESLSLARSLNVWMAPEVGVTLTAVRQQRAKGHDAEAVTAFLIEPDEEGPPTPGAIVPQLVEDPLFSTRYDGDGRQLAAGLELYVTEEGHARRAAGEVVCGTTLDLGRLRLDCAFFRWRMEGREGIGRYDILRRA